MRHLQLLALVGVVAFGALESGCATAKPQATPPSTAKAPKATKAKKPKKKAPAPPPVVAEAPPGSGDGAPGPASSEASAPVEGDEVAGRDGRDGSDGEGAGPAAPAVDEEEERGETGIASYYADSLAGRPTANGEKYLPDRRTCAHRTLPFGTKVKITVLDTGARSSCVINDRGPYAKARLIDVSKKVARKLGLLERGTARVRVIID